MAKANLKCSATKGANPVQTGYFREHVRLAQHWIIDAFGPGNVVTVQIG